MTSADLHVVLTEQHDPRLGRQCVHDPASRGYEHHPRALARPADLERQKWRHRIYGPKVTPRQRVGCCTGVDQCVKANAKGNRMLGVVLGMSDAERIYSRATELDPFPGAWRDGDPDSVDTGSSGLAACKAAAEAGLIERYEWIFAGPRAVLATLRERPIGVGTWWHWDMFDPDPETMLVKPTGGKAGGHQWTLVGWDPKLRAFEGRCWWGDEFGDRGLFRIRFDDLGALLADDGDAHVTYRKGRPA